MKDARFGGAYTEAEAPFLQGCPECSCDAHCDVADKNKINKTLKVISASGKLVSIQFKTDGRAVYPTHLTPIDKGNLSTSFDVFSARPIRPEIEPDLYE